jgi:glutamine synthetase
MPELDARLRALADDGVRVVRTSYPDLHGICRSKDVPVGDFAHAASHGIAFCEAIMTVDLRHNVVAGFEHGFQDIMARPDLDTLVRLPWNPSIAWCLADLERIPSGEPYEVDSRGALKRAVAALAERGLQAVIGPELEFYLCHPDPDTRDGYRRYVNNDSHVYTTGDMADPRGVVSRMLDASVALDLRTFAWNHEFGRSQFEINLRHSEALDAADRAFRFKWVVKELAAREGLLATFIGKPWNDDEGSGFHLHVSLAGDDGGNACADADSPDGLTPVARQFIAGVLEHAPALMAFFNPTTNAYRRLHPEALVPTRINWGIDNRFSFIRVPREGGDSTRAEIRVGDGAASPHLAVAATLFAGLDGLERELEPPEPVSGFIYELPEERQGPPLPPTLDAALEALTEDELIRDRMGAGLVETFLTIKNNELDRSRKWVTDWEFAEYSHHL